MALRDYLESYPHERIVHGDGTYFVVKPAAWNEKFHTHGPSVTTKWANTDGNASRGGEIALAWVPQLVEFLVREDHVPAGDVLRAVASALEAR